MTRRSFVANIGRAHGYAAAFSTMQTLGLLAQSPSHKSPSLPGHLGKGKSVAILGAGIAGMVAAYELRKAGFACTLLEACDRPGGRNWTVRNGTKIEFTDGSVQHCDWKSGLYMNAGPARIPSIHRTILGYCEEFGIPLEVEINTSRSTLMQSDNLNGGRPVEQRQVMYDTRGHIAELLSKAIDQGRLDSPLTKEDAERLLSFLKSYGDLDDHLAYTGTERAGYTSPRSAAIDSPRFRTPLPMHDLLAANLIKGEFYEDRLDWQATMFQPVGGMDRIAYRFAEHLGNDVRYRCDVKEIQRRQDGARIVYANKGASAIMDVDFCICTLPIPILRGIATDFSNATRQAMCEWTMVTQYKIAWQSPRFWEREYNIYGGISFLDQPVDLVWYPSDRLFSADGILMAGYNSETGDDGQPTAFGRLRTTAAKIESSRASVEKLHPGHGKQLTKPIYVSWPSIPYSLGSFANTHLASAQPAYKQMHEPEGNIYFAGDYLSHLPGWQEGAALSAHRVVGEIAHRVSAR